MSTTRISCSALWGRARGLPLPCLAALILAVASECVTSQGLDQLAIGNSVCLISICERLPVGEPEARSPSLLQIVVEGSEDDGAENAQRDGNPELRTLRLKTVRPRSDVLAVVREHVPPLADHAPRPRNDFLP